jgi:hypothetical protein
MTLNLTRRIVKASPLTAAEHDANLDVLETAILAPPARGQISKTTTGEIVITTIDTYVTTGLTATFDASTASGMVLGTTDTFGLKNNSGSTRLFQVYGSADVRDGNNLILGVKLALNGTPIDETECRAFTGTSGQEAKLVTNWLINLEDGDEVSLFIANHTNTSNLELRRGRVVAVEVR